MLRSEKVSDLEQQRDVSIDFEVPAEDFSTE
jgi:hypothetical protein